MFKNHLLSIVHTETDVLLKKLAVSTYTNVPSQTLQISLCLVWSGSADRKSWRCRRASSAGLPGPSFHMAVMVGMVGYDPALACFKLQLLSTPSNGRLASSSGNCTQNWYLLLGFLWKLAVVLFLFVGFVHICAYLCKPKGSPISQLGPNWRDTMTLRTGS